MMKILGIGCADNYLKNISRELQVEHKVIFTGFIPEEKIYDYYFCDVFVSADIADYDITVHTAIGFNKNIVSTADYEFELELLKSVKFPCLI